jgi:hypothetical protein
MNYNPTSYQSASSGSGFQLFQSFFPVQIGSDMSGMFALSFQGLAVIRPDGRAVVHREGGLLDVTMFLLTGFGVSPGVFRIPVHEVFYGDLIVTSDYPLSLLYVLEQTETGVRGLDPFTGKISDYTPPLSLFMNYFVRVESLFGQLLTHAGESERREEGHEDEGEQRDRHRVSYRSLLPLLFLSSQSEGATNPLMALILMQFLEGSQDYE